MNEMKPAGASPVEPTVRPRAWEVRQGSRTYYVSDAEFVRSSYDSGEFVPLYPPEALAAERERCAKLCEEVESQAWALWKTTADPIEQGRNIGAQHCADAIRA